MTTILLLSIGKGPPAVAVRRRDDVAMEDELSAALARDASGHLLLRDSHITEVHQETTDDN